MIIPMQKLNGSLQLNEAFLLLELPQPVVPQPRSACSLLILVPRELPVLALLPLPHHLPQRRNLLSWSNPQEVDHRHSALHAVGHHPVPHAPQPPVRQRLGMGINTTIHTHGNMAINVAFAQSDPKRW